MRKKNHLLKNIIRKLIMLVFQLIPFSFAVKIVKKWPRKSEYLPRSISLTINDYLDDINANIDTTYPIERNMLTGVYDSQLQSIIDKHVKEGDICLDVGANIGAISLSLAKKVGASGKLYAFEPGPFLYQRLCNNFHLNLNLEEVTTCINKGVSDEVGELFWNEEEYNRGNANLLAKSGTSVPITTLDKYFEKEKLQSLAFVKIDVEGMEYEVMKGGIKTLKTFKPIIYFETHPIFEEIRKMNLHQMIDELLTPLGYDFYMPSESGLVKKEKLENLGTDILAIPCKKDG